MIKKIPIISLVAGLILLICSCSAQTEQVKGNADAKFPANFTISNIKSALEQYANYRLWLYPENVSGKWADTNFDPYIGHMIEVEVRLYTDSGGNQKVYTKTSMGEWLAVIELKNGIVYCDGQVSKDESLWPQNNYEVMGEFQIQVPQPHKPDFGSSARKDKMIAAAESYMKTFCVDLLSGTEHKKWVDAKVYIADFYEYESGVSAWLVRKDGYVWNSPMYFVEENDEFKAVGEKGFGIDKIDALDKLDSGRYMFEKQIDDAAKQFTCSSSEM
ncbi:hypothetical protein [Paenibacillus luteus]|uniref:hypothetical protein n=1 Tax=Paenibacillus luteus TaxID=2545753 RepID=UPI001141A3BB|nr:hypothetical protein [Paenibacillus luteus]